MGGTNNGPSFTQLWSTVIQAAGGRQARLSGAEMLTLCALMRYQGATGSILSRPAKDIARETGYEYQTTCKCLKRLCELEFWHPGEGWTPILTRLKPGRMGQTATYRLNIPREWPRDGPPE